MFVLFIFPKIDVVTWALSLSLSNMNWDCLTTFFTHKYAETGIPIYYVLSAVHYISHTTHTCSSISTTKKSMQTRKCRGFRGVAITNSYEGASIVTKREVFLRRRVKCPHRFSKEVRRAWKLFDKPRNTNSTALVEE